MSCSRQGCFNYQYWYSNGSRSRTWPFAEYCIPTRLALINKFPILTSRWSDIKRVKYHSRGITCLLTDSRMVGRESTYALVLVSVAINKHAAANIHGSKQKVLTSYSKTNWFGEFWSIIPIQAGAAKAWHRHLTIYSLARGWASVEARENLSYTSQSWALSAKWNTITGFFLSYHTSKTRCFTHNEENRGPFGTPTFVKLAVFGSTLFEG